MKTHRLIKRTLIGSVLLLASSAAWATTCSYNPANPSGNNPLIVTMPLQGGTISAGRDMPNGTVLFRQTFRASPQILIDCAATVSTIVTDRRLTSMPGKLIPGQTAFQGKVYETGVEGIGVAVWYAGNGYPFSASGPNCGGGTVTCNWSNPAPFDISFIKTGPISGGIIRGSDLPSTSEHFVTGNDLEYLRASFSGSITVVVPTCTTPDVNVPLGSYRVNDFKGIGNGTPWRDFEIRLNNCPAISGYFTGGAGNYPIWYSDGGVENGTRTGHPVTYQLNPKSGAIDAARGVARLSASSPGNAPAATGIGVQIANRSDQPRQLGAFLAGVTMRPGQLGGQNMSIPLRARYIQVADTVTAGPANAAVEFVLNYQ